jgi:5'-3' exonuclease
MSTTTVHLIDASPYLFRAFFSVPKSIVDGSGKISNAVYGFTMFLARYIADEKPTHIAVAFDRNFNGSFRNEIYPPYKAQREASPPELEAQVDPALAVTKAIGVATYIDDTHEADDLIATIIEQTDRKDVHYVIVSSDKDLTQLVNARTAFFDYARKARFDSAAVVEKFGVKPEQMTDLLGLAGDSVDNIPGVKGVGPKTAAQLLHEYGSLERLYANLGAMKNRKLAAKLEEHAEIAALSKQLATVSRESPIKVKLDDLRYREQERPAKEIMDELLGR